jgi:hypothetical protein
MCHSQCRCGQHKKTPPHSLGVVCDCQAAAVTEVQQQQHSHIGTKLDNPQWATNPQRLMGPEATLVHVHDQLLQPCPHPDRQCMVRLITPCIHIIPSMCSAQLSSIHLCSPAACEQGGGCSSNHYCGPRATTEAGPIRPEGLTVDTKAHACCIGTNVRRTAGPVSCPRCRHRFSLQRTTASGTMYHTVGRGPLRYKRPALTISMS